MHEPRHPVQDHPNQPVLTSVILRPFHASLIVILLICLVLQLALAVGGIRFHSPDIGGLVEPNVIYTIERVVAGHPLYEDPEQPPFSVGQYSPLYYLLAARIITLLDIDPRTDVWSVYAVARSVSFLGWLLTAVVVYMLAVRVLNVGTFVGFVLGSLTIIVPSITGIAARPDSLARLLTLTAFCCYLAADAVETRTRKYFMLTASVALVVLAVWTKQTSVQMLLVFAILSVMRKRWIDLGLMFALSVACSVLIYLPVAGSLGGGGHFIKTFSPAHLAAASISNGLSACFGNSPSPTAPW